MDEVNKKLNADHSFVFLIDGTPINSPLNIPTKARIIIVSNKNKFNGLKNL